MLCSLLYCMPNCWPKRYAVTCCDSCSKSHLRPSIHMWFLKRRQFSSLPNLCCDDLCFLFGSDKVKGSTSKSNPLGMNIHLQAILHKLSQWNKIPFNQATGQPWCAAVSEGPLRGPCGHYWSRPLSPQWWDALEILKRKIFQCKSENPSFQSTPQHQYYRYLRTWMKPKLYAQQKATKLG